MNNVLLAVLGRGTQMVTPNGGWVVTEDIETQDGFAHFPIRVPVDDDHENSVIGGGALNLAAAVELYRGIHPKLAVFAYGNRSSYLAENHYPSESEVMTEAFADAVKKRMGYDARVEVFDERTWKVNGSGTYQEIHNILTLALRNDIPEVVLVTVAVHMIRALGMVAQHRRLHPEFEAITITPRASEFVLLEHASALYGDRAWRIFESQSLIRNLRREANGLEALRKNVTQITQPGVVIKT